jgi:hypothetical protein
MSLRVVFDGGEHRLFGDGADELANRSLPHLSVRGFAPATGRAYARGVLTFLRLLAEEGLGLVEASRPICPMI